MTELREAHLRYLLAIYELGKIMPDVGTQDIAKTLHCSKASVTKMMGILMDMDLLVRERYGKIYLTDTGFLLAKDLLRCVEIIRERLPALGLDLTQEETEEYTRMMAMNLPEHSRNHLAGRSKAYVENSEKSPENKGQQSILAADGESLRAVYGTQRATL